MKTTKMYLLTSFLMITIISMKAQTQWTKYNNNPVMVKGPDIFDIAAIGQPTVLIENDTIKMWYVGVSYDLKGRICYAYSLDGIIWTKHDSPVIDVGNDGEWDSGWLDTPEIVKDNQGYKLYYYGDTARQFSAISSAIGVATSTDGINWTKYTGNPIFTKGNVGEWDGTWVESPTVYYDSTANQYLMWYNGIDTTTWKIQIGLATSSDGYSWNKYFNNPVVATSWWGGYDDIWLGTPTVIKADNQFEMWYASTSTNSYNYGTSSFDTVNICYATSIDGINWQKSSANPLFNTYTTPYDSLVDTGGPWAPSVIYNPTTNKYMMWYEAHGGNYNYTLSLATAPKDEVNIKVPLSTNNIAVYPNPTKKFITIYSRLSSTGTLFITIKNIQNCSMFNGKMSEEKTTIDVEKFPSGIYFIEISNQHYTSRIKFIKL